MDMGGKVNDVQVCHAAQAKLEGLARGRMGPLI